MTDSRPDIEQQVVAYVDGHLDAAGRDTLESRARTEPDLAAAIARQRVAVSMISAAASEVSAPLALRAAVERLAARGRRPLLARLASRTWLVPASAAAAAAAAALLLVALPGGAPGVGDIVAAAIRPPVAAVSVIPGKPLLREQVEGVRFPDFAGKFGRPATGTREDEIDGRPTRTVFYEGGVAYTIVGGEALDEPPDADSVTREGTRLSSFSEAGRTVVTWRRQGHTCVLSSSTVPRETLITLAAWRAKGGIDF